LSARRTSCINRQCSTAIWAIIRSPFSMGLDPHHAFVVWTAFEHEKPVSVEKQGAGRPPPPEPST
jgi:hypothetical protein